MPKRSATDSVDDAHQAPIVVKRTYLPSSHPLNHIILPHFVPNDANIDIELQTSTILTHLKKVVRDAAAWVPAGTIAMVNEFVRVHESPTAHTIKTAIDRMEAGSTFAMYVKWQNAAFVCHVPAYAGEPNEATEVIVATFPGQVAAKCVYGGGVDFEVRCRLYSIGIFAYLESNKLAYCQGVSR